MTSRLCPASLLFLIIGHTSNAAPIAESPSTTSPSATIVGYVGEPNGRGTSSIVLSCLLTLILCVWSALHLNVPGRSQSLLEELWLSTRWVIAGIYAPELVVFTAWRQWSSARILQSLIEDHISLEAKEGGLQRASARKHKWTMTHSFFACTGGFAFEVERDQTDVSKTCPASFLPEGCTERVSITARGMAFLVRTGHLPDIAREEIEDKSKANALAKLLVVIQATWMLLQVIARLITRLPVTLLEVNTVAHV